MKGSPLAGWTPIWVGAQAAGPYVDWCHLGGLRFTDSFFHDTIERVMPQPFNLLFRQRTTIEALGELHAAQPGLRPKGFIFHMSRCGSTLISQMLSALPQNLVISEAGPIDALLRAKNWNQNLTEDQHIAWFRWLVSALGQPRQAGEENYFIKFDSWNILDLPLIHRAFPEVPWIFAYREPVEVIVSNLNQLAGKMMPGVVNPALIGCDLVAAVQMPREEYFARILAKFCQSALEQHMAHPALLLNYTQLPEAVFSAVKHHFQLTFSAEDMELMRQKARYNVKQPTELFASDTQAKVSAATPFIHALADQWVRPFYQQLEAASRAG